MNRAGRPFRSKLMMWIAVMLFAAACLLFAVRDPANPDPKLFLAGVFGLLFAPADFYVSILLFTQKRE